MPKPYLRPSAGAGKICRLFSNCRLFKKMSPSFCHLILRTTNCTLEMTQPYPQCNVAETSSADLKCTDCLALITNSTIPQLFAIMRQWSPGVQTNLDIIVKEVSNFTFPNLFSSGPPSKYYLLLKNSKKRVIYTHLQ